mmetsp:Transcript_18169/g.41752  ORF Transcript_18169/g.41752 Transcript_18169/m.41752 type:complete len:203 (-) Transcript_18169:157-765(-)
MQHSIVHHRLILPHQRHVSYTQNPPHLVVLLPVPLLFRVVVSTHHPTKIPNPFNLVQVLRPPVGTDRYHHRPADGELQHQIGREGGRRGTHVDRVVGAPPGVAAPAVGDVQRHGPRLEQVAVPLEHVRPGGLDELGYHVDPVDSPRLQLVRLGLDQPPERRGEVAASQSHVEYPERLVRVALRCPLQTGQQVFYAVSVHVGR